MKGNVIGFDPDTNTGAVSGHDGKRYEFVTQDWHGHSIPHHGDLVDFTAENERATQIFLLEPEYVYPGFWAFYFSAEGRASRSQYWLKYVLPVVVIGLALDLLALAGGRAARLAPDIFQLVVLWPGIAMLIKRIHDRNKSGWLVWLLYAPLILAVIFTLGTVVVFGIHGVGAGTGLGFISVVLWIVTVIVAIWFFIEFGCMRGTIGANWYGPDPVPHR